MPRVPAEQRRQELIEAAFTVMARDGVAAASTRAITAEAGAPLSAFHYCFRSKQELLRELTTTVVNDMVAEASQALQPGANLRDAVHDALRLLWSVTTSHPDQQLVLYELTCLSMRDPVLDGLGKWQYECYFEAGARFLEDLATMAGVTWRLPVPVVSRMCVTFIDGLTLGWLPDRNDEQALAAVDSFAEMLTGLAEPVRRSAAARVAAPAAS
jgi:AcrR family transcriptional regulator